ncbi:xylulokinase [Pseudomonas sp. NCHU5208]|uniref:xylulokinase n=1 Tax=unclassified Pseudomonas TaxID=196821 RepID=UPI003F9999FD
MTHDTRLVLAVDLGSSGCKTALVGLDGHVRAFAFRPVQTHVLAGSGVEQCPEDWWHALLDSAAEVLDSTSAHKAVAAICCSCQGEGTVPVDRDGQPLARALLYMDMRGQEAVRRQVGGILPRVAGYDPLKLWRWLRLTGGAPALSGKDPFGHIAFIRDAMPELYARTDKFLNVLDFINLRLSGRIASTVDSALTTWVTDNRDPGNIRYHDGLLRMAGLQRSQLPELVRCCEVLGELRKPVAERLGLRAGLPVVAGAVDTTASAMGSGAVRDNALHLYIGTSSWIGAHVQKKKTDVMRQIAALPCALPDRYMMIAMQSAAGANLSFLRDRILYAKDALLQNEAGPDVYRILDEVAASVPAGARGLLYLPWLMGERSPVDDGNLRAGLVNMTLEHAREDMVRAFLEGVALNTRWMMEAVDGFIGQPSEEITLVGGGGQSEVWCRIFADVLGVTVHLPQQPIQANARGAAFIAGIGIDAMAVGDIPERVEIRRSFQPDRLNAERYASSYANFRAAHKALAPFYAHLHRGTHDA